jgi:pteridine reductase
MSLKGKLILITGAARRIGKALALGVARAGGDVIIHHGHSPEDAIETRDEIQALGATAYILRADFNDINQAATLISEANRYGSLFALVNNAAIFDALNWANTDMAAWNRHLQLNLTVPFLLSQEFARQLPPGSQGRVVNILDWRALRPGSDHLPYTISKAGLAALTRSLAIALAPEISVNGLALGAILPPADGGCFPEMITKVPAGRWAILDEVVQGLLFLLEGPAYITGEIIHIDGGRHLT